MKTFSHFIINHEAKVKLSHTDDGSFRIEINGVHPMFGEHILIEITNLDKLELEE